MFLAKADRTLLSLPPFEGSALRRGGTPSKVAVTGYLSRGRMGRARQ